MHLFVRAVPSRARFAGAVTLAMLIAFAGCDDDSPTELDLETDIEEVITSISSGTVSGSLEGGSPPSDESAPTPVVTGSNTVIPGGGARYTISSDADFSVIYVFVEGQEGYYQLDLGSQQSAASFDIAAAMDRDVILTLGEVLGENVEFCFSVGVGNGAGQCTTQEVDVIEVGTGDVQVSVSWDVPSDVDLYLVEPSGETIYFGNEESETGGVLDLDSNAACGSPDVRNENITWPDDVPPSGEYTVRVNYWSACDQQATNWVVTLRVEGQETRTFEGQFTGAGVGGGQDAGEVVTTFTF